MEGNGQNPQKNGLNEPECKKYHCQKMQLILNGVFYGNKPQTGLMKPATISPLLKHEFDVNNSSTYICGLHRLDNIQTYNNYVSKFDFKHDFITHICEFTSQF